MAISGVDEPGRSGTPFRHLIFSRNSRSSTYCQISRNAFYLPSRHLFTMGGDYDYEFMTSHCFTVLLFTASSRMLHNRVHTLLTSLIPGANKSFIQ